MSNSAAKSSLFLRSDDASLKPVITPEEEKYRAKEFPDENSLLKKRRLNCTVCGKNLKSEIVKNYILYVHPSLEVIFCKDCKEFYNIGNFSIDEDSSDKYCRWCGQGGSLYCCSFCSVSICAECVERNLPHSYKKKVEDDDWRCFVCIPEPVWAFRAVCHAAKQYVEAHKPIKTRQNTETDSKGMSTSPVRRSRRPKPEEDSEKKTLGLPCTLKCFIAILVLYASAILFMQFNAYDLPPPTQVSGSLTKLQCYPTSGGAAAVILASEDFVLRNNLQRNAVEILGMEMTTNLSSIFNENNCLKVVGYNVTRLAADRLFSKANRKPTDVNMGELHDRFSANELITYEAVGLCSPGRADELVDLYGGKYVVNRSGGLISNGHLLRATGLEGAVVVSLYQHGFPYTLKNSVSLNAVNAYVDDPNCFKVGPSFKILKEVMQDNRDSVIDGVRGIYCFKVKNIKGQQGMRIINAKAGNGSVTYKGTATLNMKSKMTQGSLLGLKSSQVFIFMSFVYFLFSLYFL